MNVMPKRSEPVPSVVAAVVACLAAVVAASLGCSKPAEPPAPVAVAPQAPPATSAEPAAQPAAAPSQDTAAATPPAGDPLVTLLAALAKATDGNARVLVIDDIAKLGQNAKNALEKLVAATTDADPRVRWHAARAVGHIGEDALSAMPTLVTLLGDGDPIVATQAAAAIGLIREDDGRATLPAEDAKLYASAVEPLVASATHADARVRRSALKTLKRLFSSPRELAPLLTKQLADADPSVVTSALHTLADMDESAVPFLLESLKDPKARYWATLALTEIGPEAAPATELLAKLAAESEPEERMQALLALAAIGDKARAAAPVMVKALESEDGVVRFAAAFALGSVKAAEGDAALEKAAADDDAFLASVASWARAKIHPDDETLVTEAVVRMRNGLKSERANVQTAAASGLSDLADVLTEARRGELAADFVPLLAAEDPDVNRSGGAALIRLGPAAVATMRKCLADPALKGRALEVLAGIGSQALPALDDLTAALDDADPAIREEAAAAIASIGAEAAPAVPKLHDALKAGVADGGPVGVAYTAAYALGKIGPAAKPAAETLRSLAAAKDEILATVAVWATLKISPDDTSLLGVAIPALRKAVRAPQDLVRLEAAVALGDLGPAAKEAIPILELVSEEDSVKAVRAAAAAALEKIKGG